MLPRSPLLRLVAGAGAAVLTFILGVVAGAAGSTAPPEPAQAGGVLDEVAARIADEAVQPVTAEALQRSAVEGMLSSLGDRYAAYYDSSGFDDFQQSLGGRYSGVGVWLQRDGLDDDAPVRVTQVLPGSAAAMAGVSSGDEVVAVGGEPVAGRPVSDIVAQLRGNAGSAVSLRLSTAGAPTRDLVLTRTAVTADDVEVAPLGDGVLSIRVVSFTRGVGSEVANALRTAHPAPTGIVLDLRGDPGGLLDEAVSTASVFLDGGPVVTYSRRGSDAQVLDATPAGDTTTPMVVLVDGGTASAAEVVAGALQDRGRAVLIGSTTFGKGSVQEPLRLSDGSAVELTVGRYLTPLGRALDGVGLQPDVEVPPGSGRQVAVSRALEVLVGLLADAGGRG